MSREGMKAARAHGELLPSFPSLEAAEQALHEMRDDLTQELPRAAVSTTAFSPDFSPESLKGLERWYFDLWENEGFEAAGFSRETCERAISMYLGEVLVRSAGFHWMVEEYAFQPGRFEIGVRKGLLTIMLRRETDLFARPNNKRRESLWRRYCDWAGA